jgi:hypothetical protein
LNGTFGRTPPIGGTTSKNIKKCADTSRNISYETPEASTNNQKPPRDNPQKSSETTRNKQKMSTQKQQGLEHNPNQSETKDPKQPDQGRPPEVIRKTRDGRKQPAESIRGDQKSTKTKTIRKIRSNKLKQPNTTRAAQEQQEICQNKMKRHIEVNRHNQKQLV